MLRKLIVSMVLLLTITTFATAEVYLNDPLPKDGKANVSLLTDISVRYSSSLGGDEVIEFYNFVDNRYQTGIGSCTANNGSRCNISLEGLQPNKQYRWIAVVNKSGNLTFSDVWQFTTEREGSPPSVVPPLSYNESEDRPVFTVYSVVRDLEGGDNIRRCTLTAEDEDGNTNSYNMTLDDTYGNRSKAICRTEVSLYDNTGWRPEELLELAITVEDKDNNIKTFQDSYSTPDVTNSSSFAPLDPSPEDGELNVSLVPTLSAVYQDPEGESGVLRFYNATGYNIGLCSADSGNRCGVKGQELEPGTVYRWYVVADDGNNTVRSSKWSFKTVSRGKKEFNQTNQTKEVNQKDQTDQTQETEGPAEQSKGIRGIVEQQASKDSGRA